MDPARHLDCAPGLGVQGSGLERRGEIALDRAPVDADLGRDLRDRPAPRAEADDPRPSCRQRPSATCSSLRAEGNASAAERDTFHGGGIWYEDDWVRG